MITVQASAAAGYFPGKKKIRTVTTITERTDY